MTTLQRTKSGTIQQTGIMTGCEQRREIYTRNDDGGIIITESCFAVDSCDHSPRVDNDPESKNHRRYDAACAYCFLGLTHSINKHDQAIKAGTA